ncbi:MAG: glycosyltransferase [Gemmataceae bacterium]
MPTTLAPEIPPATPLQHVSELTEERFRRRDAELRNMILRSFVKGVAESGTWKLTAPLRTLARVLKPSGCGRENLIAWQDLTPGDRDGDGGDWNSTGIDPQFIVPCYLPAGWVRIKLELSGVSRGRTELYIDTGDGFHCGECLERFAWSEILRDELFVRLSRPVFAIRLDPIDCAGKFHLEQFSVSPVPPPQALWQAVSKKFRLLFAYRCAFASAGRGLGLPARGRFGEFARRVFKGLPDSRRLDADGDHARAAYAAWRRQRELTDANRQRLRAEAAALANPPVISIIMPAYNTPEIYLKRAVESVLRQTYSHWELCIADDGSAAKHVERLLRKYEAADARVKVVRRPRNGGISAASNLALELATGPYVALLDHDDELAEHALSAVARTLVEFPETDMVYSDEDKLEMDERFGTPFFKPDWAPDYFLTCMYTCHLGVYRTEIVRKVGGFRSSFDSAQDYDLALRVVAHVQNEEREKTGHGGGESRRIRHIADVLYHWRKIPGSTAIDHKAKPQAAQTAIAAVQSYLEAVDRPGAVEPGPSAGLQRVRYRIQGNPKISIVIPSAGRPATVRGKPTTFIGHVVRSIRAKSSYANYEILVVDNDDMSPDLQRDLDGLGVVLIPYTAAFNLSTKMNLGAAKADGEFLLLLNDDMEVITPDWLECLLEHAQWPEVGAVGAKLLFPDGRLQHAGVTLLEGKPHHHYYRWPGSEPGYFSGNFLTRNYSAVTGACLMTKTDLFHELGGFDAAFPLNFNDIDFCLKVRRSGRRVVFTPYAQLYHFESASKTGCYAHEVQAFIDRWGQEYALDPFYSPHLATDSIDYRLATVKNHKN